MKLTYRFAYFYLTSFCRQLVVAVINPIERRDFNLIQRDFENMLSHPSFNI